MDPILILITVLSLLVFFLGVGVWVGIGLFSVAITSLALFRSMPCLGLPMRFAGRSSFA